MRIESNINNRNLYKDMDMDKNLSKLVITLLLTLLLMPLVLATPSYIFKKDSSADLKIHCFDLENNLCDEVTINCYLTIHYPDSNNYLSNVSMTRTSDYYNYTLNSLTQTGEYPTVVRCEGNNTGFSTFTFEVTPTGNVQTSILNNPFLILFGVLALALIGMGMYMRAPWIGFLGSLMFIIGGIYTMIYGFNNVTDLYSRSVAGVFIGIGFIFMFISAYEFGWGDR